MDYSLTKQIDELYNTPFFILHSDKFINNVKLFKYAFVHRNGKVIVCHSFKTNYVNRLCELSKQMGCYAEVVSEFEYALAKHIGFSNIIVNGPIKAKSLIFDAIKDGHILVLNSEFEVSLICQLKRENPNLAVKIGLRINLSPNDYQDFSRFGIPVVFLDQIIKRLSDANVPIILLHSHISDCLRQVEKFEYITHKLLDIAEHYCLDNVQYIDVGGGFGGAVPNGMTNNYPSYEDYANGILKICFSNSWYMNHQPFIVIEPGVSVVANVFSYITKVYDKKMINNRVTVTVDGSCLDIKPSFHNKPLPFKIINQTDTLGQNEPETIDVVGSTCLENDILLSRIKVKSIKLNDYIQFDGVGAYTITMTPTFINYLATILALENGMIRIIRRRQNLEDILRLYP